MILLDRVPQILWLIRTLIVAISFDLLIFAGISGATCTCANQLCQLNEEQSALYLTCTMVAQGAQIPTNLTSDLLGTLNLLSMERTAEFKTVCGATTVSKLPSLNGLTYLQLATEQIKSVKDFAVEQFPFVKNSKAPGEALVLFETMNNGTCATLAQGFTIPKVPVIKLSTSSLNFGKVPVWGFAALSFQIANVGAPVLSGTVNESTLDSVFFGAGSVPFFLKLGRTLTVSISFRPTAAISYSGTITINSNDPSHPSLKVALSGTGT